MQGLKEKAFDPQKFISEDFLQILNEHRKSCEREGKLEQASMARKRLKELRIFEEQKRKDETFQRHVSLLYRFKFITDSLIFIFVEIRDAIA